MMSIIQAIIGSELIIVILSAIFTYIIYGKGSKGKDMLYAFFRFMVSFNIAAIIMSPFIASFFI